MSENRWGEVDHKIAVSTARIGREIQDERIRAHEKHGAKSMEGWPTAHPARLPILVEEVGEVAREMNEAALADRPIRRELLRAELVQVAAMAVGWIAALDRGDRP